MTALRNFMQGFAFIALVPVFASIVLLAFEMHERFSQ